MTNADQLGRVYEQVDVALAQLDRVDLRSDDGVADQVVKAGDLLAQVLGLLNQAQAYLLQRQFAQFKTEDQ